MIIKQNISEKTFDAISFNEDINIQSVCDFFNISADKGATKVNFRAITAKDGYSQEVEIYTYFEREETEEELNKRESAKKTKQLNKEIEERELLERLKRKYEIK